MNLAREAYIQLYGKEPDRHCEMVYHGNLKGYNATVRKTPRILTFRMSTKFKDVEPEIKIGVMQFLMNKLNKTKINSDNINMYHSFLKKMSDLAPVTESDPVLEASFKRVNEKYFSGMLAQPNLVWGGFSASLLGTYTYATDTIMISQVMREDEHLLDYVMHHEMLHKRHKFNHSSSRTHAHTPAFRADEAKFEDKHAETKLKAYLRDKRGAPAVGRKSPVPKPGFVQRLMGWT